MADAPPDFNPSGGPPQDLPDLFTPEETIKRNPIVTGLLALIPGAGHAFIGRSRQGAGYFGLTVVMGLLLYWAQVTTEFEVFPGLWIVLLVVAILFYVFTIFSAVSLAGDAEKFYPRIALILILSFTYLLGWQATEVNLQKFFTEFSDTFDTFSRILWPWNAAIDPIEDVLVVSTPFLAPCPDDPIASSMSELDNEFGAQITLEPGCGVMNEDRTEEPGTDLMLVGTGFVPNTEVVLWWEDPIGEDFRPNYDGETLSVVTDADGNFELAFEAPRYNTPGQAVGIQEHEAVIRQLIDITGYELSENFLLALNRLIITIFQALMATSFGIIFAFPISFLAARNLMWGSPLTRVIYYAVRFIMNVSRSIEPLIWAVIAVIWVGLSPFAGVIALTIHTIAALGKLYSESIESIDSGPIEAVTATGANGLQTIMYAIVPQIIPPYLSFTIYRWDINVRMSTILGFVGGGGIGQILSQWINQSLWSSAGIAVWMIAITVSVLDYASAELRKRFV
ncbi:MAG: phosphonate ABC transporter, permease protein PhnE [Chloroflexi bacterium]|nr:phosphonate ABC transporter, permease protein PhnE [Chloroflexota bacterium]